MSRRRSPGGTRRRDTTMKRTSDTGPYKVRDQMPAFRNIFHLDFDAYRHSKVGRLHNTTCYFVELSRPLNIGMIPGLGYQVVM